MLGHLLVTTILDGGVQRINFGFVAARYASPFWRTWDLLMLWLAELHGTNGLRTIINDYAGRPRTRFWLKMLLYSSAGLVVTLVRPSSSPSTRSSATDETERVSLMQLRRYDHAYDVVVVGAGAAGLRTALAASGDARTAVLSSCTRSVP